MVTPRFLFLASFLFLLCGTARAGEGAVPRDGFALHYRTEGSGTPIVFLSGGPGLDVDYMKAAAALFPSTYQRVFLEQRGTGRSRPASLSAGNVTLSLVVGDVEALRTALNVERLILVGHSWGGMLAMAYAASYPDNVDRLILISSGGPTTEFFGWFGDNLNARLRPEDIEARDRWVEAARRGSDPDKADIEIIKATTPAFFFDRAKGLAFAAATPAGSHNKDLSGLLFADLQKNYDVRDGLRRLRRPVLILHGHQDPIGDKVPEDIHALVPSATLRYLNRCGHFPWIEQPEATRALLTEFLAPK